jgi:hypothetical protein
VTANQEYILRCIDQAEAKAAKALRGVRQQLQRLRALNGAGCGGAPCVAAAHGIAPPAAV